MNWYQLYLEEIRNKKSIDAYIEDKIKFKKPLIKLIRKYAKNKKIDMFVSPWDTDSVDFLEKFNPCCYKIASACLTDIQLLNKIILYYTFSMKEKR